MLWSVVTNLALNACHLGIKDSLLLIVSIDKPSQEDYTQVPTCETTKIGFLRYWFMKLGIVLLVIGIVLLVLVIPYSISGIISGVIELEEGNISGRASAYYGVFGVIAGLVMVGIGAIKVFKQ
ncbi:hypothetical protein ACFLTO_01990 [Chloroflexota bacterium]